MEPTVFLYENGVSIQQFTAKYSDIKPYPLFLGNISKNISVNYMKNIELNRHICNVYVIYEAIHVSYSKDIYNHSPHSTMQRRLCLICQVLEIEFPFPIY